MIRKSPFDTAEKALSHDDKGIIDWLFDVSDCALTSYEIVRKTAYLQAYCLADDSARFSCG